MTTFQDVTFEFSFWITKNLVDYEIAQNFAIFNACWNALNLSANRVIVSETGSKCCLDGYIDQILEG